MKKTVIRSGACVGLGLALLMMAGGIVVFVLIPVFGWVAGPIIIFCALFVGGKQQKVWRCSKCRYILPRG